MSDKVRIECGAGAVEVWRSGIRGHVVLAVDAPGGRVSLRADEVGLVLAAIAELLPRGGERVVSGGTCRCPPMDARELQHDPMKPWAALTEGMEKHAEHQGRSGRVLDPMKPAKGQMDVLLAAAIEDGISPEERTLRMARVNRAHDEWQEMLAAPAPLPESEPRSTAADLGNGSERP